MLTINVPDNLVEAFKDFVEVHAEMFLETDDGSSPEVTDVITFLLEQINSN